MTFMIIELAIISLLLLSLNILQIQYVYKVNKLNNIDSNKIKYSKSKIDSGISIFYKFYVKYLITFILVHSINVLYFNYISFDIIMILYTCGFAYFQTYPLQILYKLNSSILKK